MTQNLVATISAVWLFLAPTLCAAGVLTHPCECTKGLKECGICCVRDDAEGCDCGDRGCSHDGCDNDPCGVTAAQKELRAPTFEVVSLGLLYPFQKHRSPADGSLAASCGPPGLAKNLPYAPSDIPLRV